MGLQQSLSAINNGFYKADFGTATTANFLFIDAKKIDGTALVGPGYQPVGAKAGYMIMPKFSRWDEAVYFCKATEVPDLYAIEVSAMPSDDLAFIDATFGGIDKLPHIMKLYPGIAPMNDLSGTVTYTKLLSRSEDAQLRKDLTNGSFFNGNLPDDVLFYRVK